MKLTIVLVMAMVFSTEIAAQEAVLEVNPKKCIALRKGQVCYQTVKIQFDNPSNSDFCLVMNELPEPLQCWSDSRKAEYSYRIASDSDVEFRMIDRQEQTIATARVSIAWVYKQTRKRYRWRLF